MPGSCGTEYGATEGAVAAAGSCAPTVEPIQSVSGCVAAVGFTGVVSCPGPTGTSWPEIVRAQPGCGLPPWVAEAAVAVFVEAVALVAAEPFAAGSTTAPAVAIAAAIMARRRDRFADRDSDGIRVLRSRQPRASACRRLYAPLKTSWSPAIEPESAYCQKV